MGSESQHFCVGLLCQLPKARAQNGISSSYMDAVFELVAHEESEIWIRLSHNFIKEGLSRVCVASAI